METRPASAQSMTIRRQPPQTMKTLHEVPGACVQKIKTPFHMKIDPGFSVDPSTIRRTKQSHFLITRPRKRCRRPKNERILASFPRGENRGERQKSRKIVKIAITPPRLRTSFLRSFRFQQVKINCKRMRVGILDREARKGINFAVSNLPGDH